tara:strand:- start:39 stop:497 length:459 start_codon:yes stop_codon:yes gene_type:complete
MDIISLSYASSIVSLLTNGVINVAINDTSVLLLSIFSNINTESYLFKITIENIDLYNKLLIIDNFMNIIPNKYENNKCISVILKSIHDIIIKIYNELSIINNIIAYHKTKYFYKYRTPNYKKEINNIIDFKNILDNRFDTLLKIMNTFKIYC